MYDYDTIYAECIKLYPDMMDIIEYIKGILPLKAGERYVLYNHMKNGDKSAKNRLMNAYLPVALRLSMEAAIKNEIPLWELFSDATIGLYENLMKCGEEELRQLTMCVSRWINHAIGIHIKKYKYAFPVHSQVNTAIPIVKKAKEECVGVSKFNTIGEISKITSLPKATVKLALLCIEPPLNYYEYSKDLWYDGDQIIHRRIIAFEVENMMREIFSQSKHIVYSHRDTQLIVPYSLRLTDREKSIICKRYGMFRNEILSYEEIAEAYDLSINRIRQIEHKALSKLRGIKELKKYIDL